MGRIPEETVEEVQSRADLATVIGGYVTLQKRGADFWCCCPFHKEKTPSFKLSPGHGTYHCFGCGVSGNVFKFVMEMENVDFPAAVRLLAKQTGVHIPEDTPGGPGGRPVVRDVTKDGVFDLLGKAAEWFRQQLAGPGGADAREYLAERGIDRDTVARFGIGYAPDAWDGLLNWGKRQGFNLKLLRASGLLSEREQEGKDVRLYDRFRGRIMFPIWDELGRVAGFSGRVLDNSVKTAKYVNTPESITFHKGRLLYCLNIARKAFKESGCALICEGQLDVIACHRAGLTHAVAPQGTAFTEEQAKLLRRHTENVVFAFDADAAGIKAAVRSLEVAIHADLKAEVVTMPEGEDPDGLFRKGGAEALREVMGSSREAFDFLFTTVSGTHDLASPHGKQAVVGEMLSFISKIPETVTRAGLCQWLSAKVGIPETTVFEALNEHRKKQQRTEAFRRRNRASADSYVPPEFEPPQGMAIAPAAIRSAVAVATEDLLDLALHYPRVAQQLAVNEHLTVEGLGSGNIERALLLVLQRTVEDQWQNAGKAIGADHVLSADPGVVRLLHSSRFQDPCEDGLSEAKKRARTHRIDCAVHDCLATIEADHLRRREEELKQALKASNPSETVTLMTDLMQIAKRKKNLHPTSRGGVLPPRASTP